MRLLLSSILLVCVGVKSFSSVERSLAPKTISEKYVLNEVRAVISNPTETALILTLDIRPTLAGEPRTLRDVVLEQLMLFDAQKFNIPVSDEDIDRYLKQLQKINNCSLDQIEQLFAQINYTLEEGREQLKRKEIIDAVKRFRFQDVRTLPIDVSRVQAWWNEHAPIQEATIQLAYAFVPSNQSKEEFEKSLASDVRKEPIAWESPMTIKISELVESKQFLATGQIGQIVNIEHVPGGFELTKILGKTTECKVPLKTGNEEEDKKRQTEIENIIRQERIKERLHAYECELLYSPHYSIRFTYESDKQEVYAGCEAPILSKPSN